jgi:hypothetical protein
VVKEYLDPIIKSKEMSYPPQKKVTPLFVVRYGDGKLLSSLIWESYQDCTPKTRNDLKRTLAMLIMDFIDP